MADGDKKKHVEAAVAIVFNAPQDRVLICKRKADTVLGGYWEFPGGKCDPGETLEQCVLREVMEEVGIYVEAAGRLPVIEHDYPYAFVRLHPFVCRHVKGEAQRLAVADLQWVKPEEITTYTFPPANEELVKWVAQGAQLCLAALSARDKMIGVNVMTGYASAMLADFFSLGDVPRYLVVFIAGVLLLIWGVGRSCKKRKASQPPQPTFSAPLPSQSELRAMADELRQLFAELQDTSRRIAAQIQNRTTKLDTMMQEADVKIRRLEELQRQMANAPSRSKEPAASFPAALSDQQLPNDPKYRRIYELADRGKTAREIAQEVGSPQGEVELILNLRGKPVRA